MSQVEIGDRVRDPMDGRIRTVTNVVEGTVYMADGGVMGLDECTEVYLPSEVIESEPVSGTTTAIANADAKHRDRVRSGEIG